MGLKRAPHVLVLGSVLGQPKGGVWRHNRELLPRVARLLEAAERLFAERGAAGIPLDAGTWAELIAAAELAGVPAAEIDAAARG